jgi:hypothetical protein
MNYILNNWLNLFEIKEKKGAEYINIKLSHK